MPKKGRHRKNNTSVGRDFTLEDSADASKAVRKLKKMVDVVHTPSLVAEISWDQLADDAVDLVEEISDGTKSLVFRKKRNHSKTEEQGEDNTVAYPEIVWYFVSHYIKPEDVGRFAAINRTTCALTKQESFWRNLYKRYCRNNNKLPERLQIEKSFQSYGLRQRVIRALYHTYSVFTQRAAVQVLQEGRPHDLIGRRCVSIWYSKGGSHWVIYLKLKKVTSLRSSRPAKNMIEELSRIDANPEEDTQVLQVSCGSLPALPAVMGLTLSAVSAALGAGLRARRLHLGLGAPGPAARPDCWLMLDHVITVQVVDWWHPEYPPFETAPRPPPPPDEDPAPILATDFFH